MQLLPRRALPNVRSDSPSARLPSKVSIKSALLSAVAFAGVVTCHSVGLQGPLPDSIGASSLDAASDSQQIAATSPGFHEHAGRIDLNAFNQERKKAIAKDSGKLLALTEALKIELDSDPSKIQSDDVAQKVKEIEKLAHKVKDRMLEDPTPSRLLR
jgi:hypothetical protein